jgi:hypothetical protein
MAPPRFLLAHSLSKRTLSMVLLRPQLPSLEQ